MGSQAEEVQAGMVGGRDAQERQEGRTEKDGAGQGEGRRPGRLQRTSSRAGLRISFILFSTPKWLISIIFKDFLNNNSKFVLT